MTDDNSTARGALPLTVAAFALAALMLFAGLGALPLMQPDEGRNAEVAREMHEAGSWLVPTLNGNAYLDKPAFFFKASALCFSAFGVSEGAARLPSALSGLGAIILAWLFARRAYGARTAAMAVAIIATSPMFLAFSRIVIMDMTLAFFVVAAILAGARAEEFDGSRRLRWIIAGAVAAGLATVVKGPVGFALPVVVLAVWHIVEKRPRAILRLFHPVPLAVFWAIALAWFIPLCLARPDFLHYGLVEETLKRAATNSTNRAQPFYFYGYVVPAGFFAWSLLFPEGVIAAWRGRKRFTATDRFCIVWTIVVIVFFSLSKTKQPGYVLTIAIPIGLLIARLFHAAWNDPGGRAAGLIRRAIFVVAGILIVLSAGLLALPPALIARIFGASPGTMATMMPVLGPISAALALLGVLGIMAALRRSAAISLLFFAALLPALFVPNLRAITAYAGHRSCRDLVRSLPPMQPETEIVCLGMLPSALPFYLGRTVTFIDADFSELGSNYILHTLKQTNAVTHNLVHMKDLDAWFGGKTNAMFILGSKKTREQLEQLAAARGVTVQAYDRQFGVQIPSK